MGFALLIVSLLTQWSLAEYSETTALESFYLAVSSYCGEPKFNVSFLQTWSCGPACSNAGAVTDITQFATPDQGVYGFTGHYDNHCILVVRGTSTSDAWKTDLDAFLVDFDVVGCSGCKVESGFYKGYQGVRATIMSSLSQYGCKDLSLTGHSLGAAIATLATYELGNTYTISHVYNFGSPRVGNPAFASSYNAKYPDTYRITHHKDPIPHGPTLGMGYYHVANEIFYTGNTSEGFIECSNGEDKSCADQYGGNLFSDLALLACCADDHTTYMQHAVNIATDGDSCTHVATQTAVDHAYLTAAAYCDADALRRWDCGTPCEKVPGGVLSVEVLSVPFQSRSRRTGTIRGFVGRFQGGCVLSLSEPYSLEDGLEILQNTSSEDLEDVGSHCPGCKVFNLLKDAFGALQQPLLDTLTRVGCTKDADTAASRRLLVLGHGIGASLAALIAFELKSGSGYYKGTFGVEPSFQFGNVRIGNEAFVDAFRHKLGNDIFRVTHHQDPFLQYPHHSDGFTHLTQELFFDGDATWDSESYIRCPRDGEDPLCSMRYAGSHGPVSDHTQYLRPLLKVDIGPQACRRIETLTV